MNAVIDFLTNPNAIPFTAALVGMLAILALEVLMLIFAGVHLDSLFPDLDVDADIDLDADLDLDGGFHFGDWANSLLHLGKVPMIVLLSLFLGGFASGGLLLQGMVASAFGSQLTLWIAVPVAFVFALIVVRYTAQFFGRLMPKDETSAVSAEQFLGQVAVINQGTARSDMPAEARLVDGHGQTHYIHVKPETEGETFPEGTSVLLISREGYLFTAVRSDLGAHEPATGTA